MSSVVPLQAGLLTLLPARHRVTVAFVNAPGAGAPDGGVGRDLPDQARLGQLAEEQAALRRVATLVAQGDAAGGGVRGGRRGGRAAVSRRAGRACGRYEPGRTVTPITIWGTAGRNLPVDNRRPLEGRNIITLVFETGRAARIDRYAESSSGPMGAAARERGIRSAVGTPVIVEGRLWGLIFAGSTLEQPLPPDTETRLASFTELVATAIANADSRAALARLAEEQAALRRVATLVARATPPQEVFAAVAEEACLLAGRCRGPGPIRPAGHAGGGRHLDQDRRLGADPLGGRPPLGGRNVTTLVYQTGLPVRSTTATSPA